MRTRQFEKGGGKERREHEVERERGQGAVCTRGEEACA